jgi:hypothetical protein
LGSALGDIQIKIVKFCTMKNHKSNEILFAILLGK